MRLERGAALVVGALEQDLVVERQQVEGEKVAGVSSARRAMRDAAGWMRWPSVSKSDGGDDVSPSST